MTEEIAGGAGRWRGGGRSLTDTVFAWSRARPDTICLCTIIAVWLAAIELVNPVGDFPIGDDFGFAPAAWTLLDTGRLKLTDWGAMNLASQAAWGALFSALFGKTYTALRLSTLVLAGLGVVALYRLLRITLRPMRAMVGALLLALNPIYLTTAFTFMSDAPYAAMQMISLWFLVTGIERQSRWRTLAGWIMAGAALLDRQNGLAIPIAVAAVQLTREPWTVRRLLGAAAPVVCLVALQIGYQAFLRVTHAVPANYGLQISAAGSTLKAGPVEVIRNVVVYAGVAIAYIGLFVFPVTFSWWLFAGRPARSSKTLLVSVLAAYFIFFGLYLAGYSYFPFIIGIWQKLYGIGMDFTGTVVPAWMSISVNALVVVGISALLFTGKSLLPKWSTLDLSTRMAIALGLVLAAPLPLVTPWLDRYLMPVLACAILALSPLLRQLPGKALSAALAMTAVMGALSVCSVHDYLAFKRTQWRAYTDLRTHIPANQIDADWTVNGIWLMPRAMSSPVICWHIKAAYKVWPSGWPGYRTVADYPVSRWLPWDKGAPGVRVLRLVGSEPEAWHPAGCESHD